MNKHAVRNPAHTPALRATPLQRGTGQRSGGAWAILSSVVHGKIPTPIALAMSGLILAGMLRAADTNVAESVHVEELAKTSSSWNGSALPEYPRGQPEVTILRITIPPHTALPEHMHPVINAGVLLRGELTVVSAKGETLRMKAGDAIVELVQQWHHGTNEGDEPAEILVFYAGLENTPITVVRPGD